MTKMLIKTRKLHKCNFLYSRRYCCRNSELHPAYVPSKLECHKKPRHFFKVPIRHKKPFVLVLPPPNITGNLHLGHALTVTVQDALVRWKKMQGIETVWVPGMDHAGIATQMIVEKLLWKEKQQTRHDVGKEAFLEMIAKWRDDKKGKIGEQLRNLGVLLDWDREIYTLDESRSKAVVEAFIRLFDAGLIYRSDSLVNWSCTLKSAISDIEVEQLTISGPTNITIPGYEEPIQFGVLTDFAYKLDGNDQEEIVVSTTRPETMVGDVAVAVHPKDDRYSRFVGRCVVHPFRKDLLPVIADEFVDQKFGTGAVKITPAHSLVDYEVGKRHSLTITSIIEEDGRLAANCGQFSGIPRLKARAIITDELSRLGLLKGRKDHPMSVPICSRSKDVVELLVRPQWFVKCDTMAAEAIRSAKEGKLTIEPKNLEKIWFDWLENIRDWCISRQLVWGHQIPAYFCSSSNSKKTTWVAAADAKTALQKASIQLETDISNITITQDEDVLDTWFSSGLHPFSAFGWPEKTDDFCKYYPNTIMETGHDILFFWVARMVMLGIQLTGELPFNQILLHGIICDSYGRKMSKSLANVVAPEDVICGITLEDLRKVSETNHKLGVLSKEELQRSLDSQKKMFPDGIPECGSDALRFTLLSHNIKSTYINFDVKECYTNKLFCNKIWQATKFTIIWFSNVTNDKKLKPVVLEDLTTVDKWILSKLTTMVKKVIDGLENFDFALCTHALKNFLYYEFCDIYLETTKRGLHSEDDLIQSSHIWTLTFCLEIALKSLSPFMPLLSEHLFVHLPVFPGQERTLDFPQNLNWTDSGLEKNMNELIEVVTAIRRFKKTFNINPKSNPKVCLVSKSNFIAENSNIVEDLTGYKNLTVTEHLPDKFGSNILKDKVGDTTVYMQVSSEVKKSLELDSLKMLKRKEKVQKELDKMIKMVEGSSYKTKAKLEDQEMHLKKITSLRDQLSRIEYFQTIAKG